MLLYRRGSPGLRQLPPLHPTVKRCGAVTRTRSLRISSGRLAPFCEPCPLRELDKPPCNEQRPRRSDGGLHPTQLERAPQRAIAAAVVGCRSNGRSGPFGAPRVSVDSPDPGTLRNETVKKRQSVSLTSTPRLRIRVCSPTQETFPRTIASASQLRRLAKGLPALLRLKDTVVTAALKGRYPGEHSRLEAAFR